MTEETTGTAQTDGQSGEGTSEVAATTHYPETGTEESGKSVATEAAGKTGAKGTQDVEDYVYDPQEYDRATKDLPPEVQKQVNALRKQLQGSYSKKTQTIAQQRQKIEAYDAFNRDPVGNLTQMAQRLGYKLTQAQQDAIDQNQPWEPQTWDEVLSKATEKAKQELMQELGPVFSEVQNIKKEGIKSQLSEIDPGWQQYESEMKAVLDAHPSMAKDPAMLYRMSVPPDVMESRANQRALKKMEAKVAGGRVASSSTTNRQPSTGLPTGPVTFQQAYEAAKKKLADDGMTGGV